MTNGRRSRGTHGGRYFRDEVIEPHETMGRPRASSPFLGRSQPGTKAACPQGIDTLPVTKAIPPGRGQFLFGAVVPVRAPPQRGTSDALRHCRSRPAPPINSGGSRSPTYIREPPPVPHPNCSAPCPKSLNWAKVASGSTEVVSAQVCTSPLTLFVEDRSRVRRPTLFC